MSAWHEDIKPHIVIPECGEELEGLNRGNLEAWRSTYCKCFINIPLVPNMSTRHPRTLKPHFTIINILSLGGPERPTLCRLLHLPKWVELSAYKWEVKLKHEAQLKSFTACGLCETAVWNFMPAKNICLMIPSNRNMKFCLNNAKLTHKA